MFEYVCPACDKVSNQEDWKPGSDVDYDWGKLASKVCPNCTKEIVDIDLEERFNENYN